MPIRLNGVSMPYTAEDRAKAVEIISDWVNAHPVFVLHTLQNRNTFGRYLGVVLDRRAKSLNNLLLNSHVVEEIPDQTVPEEEDDEPAPDEEVVGEEVSEDELPEVEIEDESTDTDTTLSDFEDTSLPSEDDEMSSGTEDLLAEEDEAELQEEIKKATKRRRRWRLKRPVAVEDSAPDTDIPKEGDEVPLVTDTEEEKNDAEVEE